MINSEKYLMEFSGGSLAGKYLVFAGQAEKEGYPQIAQLFRTAARMETNQAHAPGGNLRRIRTTPGYRGRTG